MLLFAFSRIVNRIGFENLFINQIKFPILQQTLWSLTFTENGR